jgi:hypothetical protein
MGARLGRDLKDSLTTVALFRVRPSRGADHGSAIDAFIDFQHSRSCNVGEYASVDTNLYIRTEGALSCMLSPASILQGSRSGSSPKLLTVRGALKRCSSSAGFKGNDCTCSVM